MVILGEENFKIQPVTVKNARFGGRAQQIETGNVPIAVIAINLEVLKTQDAARGKVLEVAIKKLQQAPEASLLPQTSWVQALVNTIAIKAGDSLNGLLQRLQADAAGAKERIQQWQ
jgi:hypothetical protein